MMTANKTLDNDTREEMSSYAAKLLYDHLFETIMKNLSKIVDNDRYGNWIH